MRPMDDEAFGLLEDRETDMRRERDAEPERAHLLAADALLPQSELDDVGEQLRAVWVSDLARG